MPFVRPPHCAAAPGRRPSFAKRWADRAIHAAFGRLAADPAATANFASLLATVRRRAPGVLLAPSPAGFHPGVEALSHLARFHAAHLRPASDWPGSSRNWRPALASLAQHLLGRHPVPPFLAAAWWLPSGAAADQQRQWMIDHSRGAPFRSLPLPLVLTRRMEGLFLRSPDHIAIPYALRRAELLALEVPRPIADIILGSARAANLDHGPFWRSVWRFLTRYADQLPIHQIGPLLDYLEVQRAVPGFSLRGRTGASLLRQINEWRLSLRRSRGHASWEPSRLPPLRVERDDQLWTTVELTSSAALRAEGAALHHCVATYAARCVQGASRIWSLREHRGGRETPVLTIEILPLARIIVQVRGFANRRATPTERHLLHAWARQAGLTISSLT